MTSHQQQQQQSSSVGDTSLSNLLGGNFGYSIEQLKVQRRQELQQRQQQQQREHRQPSKREIRVAVEDNVLHGSDYNFRCDQLLAPGSHHWEEFVTDDGDDDEQKWNLGPGGEGFKGNAISHSNNKSKTTSTNTDRSDKLAGNNICQHPNYCDPNIFNPFRKKSHEIVVKSKRRKAQGVGEGGGAVGGKSGSKMKFDYRREQQAQLDPSKNTVKHASNYRNTYLFLYNLLMFVMFLMVWMIMIIKVLTGSMDDESVQGAAFIVKLLTYTQLLETIHPMLGLVPGGPFMPFLQVIGRLFVNSFLTDPTIRLSSAPYAHGLFIVWSSIEIFRYSFYALRVFNVEIYPITWCRYTLFMPLYPMGGFCESQIVLATARHYEKTNAFIYSLPNALNISFNLPLFLRFYIIGLLGPSIFYLMRYMWSQRCKQLKVKVA